MLTYAKAKALLTPGDTVFIIEGGQIVEQRILSIHRNSLTVEDGYLYFEDVGATWWLTKRVALDTLELLTQRR